MWRTRAGGLTFDWAAETGAALTVTDMGVPCTGELPLRHLQPQKSRILTWCLTNAPPFQCKKKSMQRCDKRRLHS